MRRVFISHRNGEKVVDSLLNEINDVLTTSNYDVLIDLERLNPGDIWRDEIYTWLGICHAAVVLISEDVIKGDSVWVSRECSILTWRKTLDPSFVLIPVLLPNVTVDELRTNLEFRDLGLHDLQAISFESNLQTCSQIIKRLQLIAIQSKSPLEELAEQIETQLDSVKVDILDEAFALTNVDIGRLPRFGGSKKQLALSLLQVPLRNALKALEYLLPRISRQNAVHRILEIIAPSWVDLSAARWIAYCASLETKPAAILNAATRFAAEMYVRRACCKPPRTMWHIVAVTAIHGEFVFEDLAAEVVEALLAEFSVNFINDPFDDSPEIQLTRILYEMNRRGQPVIVVLRLLASATDLMPRLQERFPYLTFLFLSGQELPSEDEYPLSLLRRVEPPLAPGRESEAKNDYQIARITLRSEL